MDLIDIIEWTKKELIGGEKLEVEMGDFFCFQCHKNVPLRLIERFPDTPLRPERTWCGTCGKRIGTYYHTSSTTSPAIEFGKESK